MYTAEALLFFRKINFHSLPWGNSKGFVIIANLGPSCKVWYVHSLLIAFSSSYHPTIVIILRMTTQVNNKIIKPWNNHAFSCKDNSKLKIYDFCNGGFCKRSHQHLLIVDCYTFLQLALQHIVDQFAKKTQTNCSNA